MTPPENIHTLTGAYAMDALDDIERATFERHLDVCDACTAEVGSFLSTAAVLAQVEEVPVSDEFRDRVLDDIRYVRQVGPLTPRMQRLAPRLSSVAAGVLLIAVISLSMVTVGLRSENQSLRDQAVIAEIAAAPDAVSLTTELDQATLHVVASPESGAGAVFAEGMDGAPTGHAYQLWLITEDGDALPAGFLAISEDGSGHHVMTGDMDGVVAVGITVEPEGGSQSPTTEPLAVLPLSA